MALSRQVSVEELSNFQQKVEIRGVLMDWVEVLSGVPQGSGGN